MPIAGAYGSCPLSWMRACISSYPAFRECLCVACGGAHYSTFCHYLDIDIDVDILGFMFTSEYKGHGDVTPDLEKKSRLLPHDARHPGQDRQLGGFSLRKLAAFFP